MKPTQLQNCQRKPRGAKSATILTEEQLQDLKRVRRYLPSAERIFLKAFQGNRPAAVKAKCLECCNLERIHVTECTIEGCPLWQIRPYQDKTKQIHATA